MPESEIVLATFCSFLAVMTCIGAVFRYTENRLTDGEFKIIMGMLFGAGTLAILFMGVAQLLK